MAPRNLSDGAGVRDGLRQQGVAEQGVGAGDFARIDVGFAGVAGGVDHEGGALAAQVSEQVLEARVIELGAGERDEGDLATVKFGGEGAADKSRSSEQENHAKICSGGISGLSVAEAAGFGDDALKVVAIFAVGHPTDGGGEGGQREEAAAEGGFLGATDLDALPFLDGLHVGGGFVEAAAGAGVEPCEPAREPADAHRAAAEIDVVDVGDFELPRGEGFNARAMATTSLS